MKRLIALGLLVSSFSAPSFAQNRLAPAEPSGPAQTVVLLASVDTSQIRLPGILFFMRHYFRTYELGLEKIFRGYFAARGYRVEVHAMADQHDLWVALHSPQNVAVYWLSHAAFSGLTGPGLGAGGEIADARGFDVTDAFQDVHPNLRFLGVIGCKSEPVILQQLRERGVLASNPQLKVSAFDRKIDAKKGLRILLGVGEQAISAPAVTAGYASACETRRGYELKATRQLPAAAPAAPTENAANPAPTKPPLYPAVRLETAAGLVLGIFPAGQAGEMQELTVYLPEQQPGAPLDAYSLKLVEDSGANAMATRDLVRIGQLGFSEPWPGARWAVFATPAGEPIGVTSYVYRYVGPDQLLTERPAEYRPFACEPMPPLR